MSIDKQARAESLKIFRDAQQADDFISFMPDPAEHRDLEPESSAARKYANTRLKTHRFASIARTMHFMFRHIFAVEGAALTALSNVHETHPDKRWQALLENTNMLFENAENAVVEHPVYQDNEQLNQLYGDLTGAYISTYKQLEAGGHTYANTSVFFLRNVQPLARAHDARPQISAGYAQLAQRSFSIPWNLAMRSVTQLVASQCEIAAGTSPLITSAAAIWRPSDVKLVGESEQGFVLTNPRNPMISEGTNLINSTLQEPTPMQELPEILGDPTIGCPITFLKGDFQALWNVQIAASVPLWAHDRPPYKL